MVPLFTEQASHMLGPGCCSNVDTGLSATNQFRQLGRSPHCWLNSNAQAQLAQLQLHTAAQSSCKPTAVWRSFGLLSCWCLTQAVKVHTA